VEDTERVHSREPLALGPADVHLWFVRPDQPLDPALLARYDALLSDTERLRNRSFTLGGSRRQHLIGRALVRSTLSRYRPIEPGVWRFTPNAWGRPEIDPFCGLRVNLSRSPRLIVCAVSLADIGVDLEPEVRASEVLKVAPRVFSSKELAALGRLPDDTRPARALTLWILKEAYAKARGMGLSLPPDSYSFSVGGGERLGIRFDPPGDDLSGCWSFRLLSHAAHCVAVACAASEDIERRLRAFDVAPLVSSSEFEPRLA
jgi:4'-phosphopantetheinyl transferase